ncbi:MAG TPA: hypothetical protein VLH13_01540, partial [Methanomassiliicoccales archaeon]|nr:hypothetical protein [Methanomassiliicoccales archaeon]
GNNMTVAFHNTPNGRSKAKTSLFKAKPEKVKSTRSTGASFENLRNISDDDSIEGPVERGIENAQMDRLVSRSHARRSVSSMNRSKKGVHRGRRDINEPANDGSDWRFI